MQTHRLPSAAWKSFLDKLTHLHRGTHVAVELGGGGLQPRCRIQGRPFIGVSASPEGDERARIDVIAGDEGEMHTLAVHGPHHLSVTELDDGSPVALQIAADDGSITSLRFGSGETVTDLPPGAYLG